jgi:hypothetical protein
MLKKSHIYYSIDLLGDGRITHVTFLVWRVPEKDTFNWFRIQFATIVLVYMDKNWASKHLRV